MLKNSDIFEVAEIAKIVAFVEILKYLQLDENPGTIDRERGEGRPGNPAIPAGTMPEWASFVQQ